MTQSPEQPTRDFLGKQATFLERAEVYLRPEGFEVDDRSLISLRRGWILFEEVMLVTFHPARSWAGAIVAGFFALIFLAMGLFIGLIDDQAPEVGWGVALFGALFAVVGAVSLLMLRWTVTIQGLRSRAVMAGTSRTKMRKVYEEAVRRVAEARASRGGRIGAAGPEVEPPRL